MQHNAFSMQSHMLMGHNVNKDVSKDCPVLRKCWTNDEAFDLNAFSHKHCQLPKPCNKMLFFSVSS